MNARTVTLLQVITELFPFPFFAIKVCPEHISENIHGTQIKLRALLEGNEEQEPKPFHK